MMASSEKWAILIGIDFYADPSKRLKGCVNDIEYMHAYLAKFVVVDTKDSTQMTPSGPAASWPTYDNITNQLRLISGFGCLRLHPLFWTWYIEAYCRDSIRGRLR